ncbi:putative Methylosome protein [Operophtera brumata]|uniref:Putative Methylosome protein n=1 Tax=Operophtera brumata TaxID=104452 RepID=A0A0L7LQP8_OPEBR|nr:putative Methylosome protein [Operophtera brumata]
MIMMVKEVWDMEDLICIRTYEAHTRPIHAVAAKPNSSNQFATASFDTHVTLWDILVSSPATREVAQRSGVAQGEALRLVELNVSQLLGEGARRSGVAQGKAPRLVELYVNQLLGESARRSDVAQGEAPRLVELYISQLLGEGARRSGVAQGEAPRLVELPGLFRRTSVSR